MIKDRKYFAFYRSFADSLARLPDEDRLSCFDAIVRYAFTREEPDTGGIVGTVFPLIKPILDRDWTQYTNGSKGGRKPKRNPNGTQTEADGEPINDDKGEKMRDKRKKTRIGPNGVKLTGETTSVLDGIL